MVDAPEKSLPESVATSAEPEGETPRLGALGGFVGFHLRLAQEASFQSFAHRVRQTDLRPGHLSILALIAENPGISQTALGRASGRDKSSLTPALHDLERRGLIVRHRVPQDQRSYALSLTGQGEEALAQLLVHARAHDEELDRIVGLDRKADFIRTLRQIALEMP